MTEDEDSVSVSPQPLGYLLVGLSSLSFSVQALCCNRLLRLDIAPIKSAAIVNLIQVGLLGLWYAVATATSADGRGGVFKWAMYVAVVLPLFRCCDLVSGAVGQLSGLRLGRTGQVRMSAVAGLRDPDDWRYVNTVSVGVRKEGRCFCAVTGLQKPGYFD